MRRRGDSTRFGAVSLAYRDGCSRWRRSRRPDVLQRHDGDHARVDHRRVGVAFGADLASGRRERQGDRSCADGRRRWSPARGARRSSARRAAALHDLVKIAVAELSVRPSVDDVRSARVVLVAKRGRAIASCCRPAAPATISFRTSASAARCFASWWCGWAKVLECGDSSPLSSWATPAAAFAISRRERSDVVPGWLRKAAMNRRTPKTPLTKCGEFSRIRNVVPGDSPEHDTDLEVDGCEEFLVGGDHGAGSRCLGVFCR